MDQSSMGMLLTRQSIECMGRSLKGLLVDLGKQGNEEGDGS